MNIVMGHLKMTNHVSVASSFVSPRLKWWQVFILSHTAEEVVVLPLQEHSNPEQVYETIETLLPTGKGALLEMFAPPHAHREGWVHVVQ